MKVTVLPLFVAALGLGMLYSALVRRISADFYTYQSPRLAQALFASISSVQARMPAPYWLAKSTSLPPLKDSWHPCAGVMRRPVRSNSQGH